MNNDLTSLTLVKAHEKLVNKDISATELTKAFLDRIEKVNPKIKAFITITEEIALEKARKIDDQDLVDKDRLLTGIPLTIKDILSTDGIKTTCASKLLENYVPPYNATVVDKLEDLQTILMGKTNMDEFAMGSSTENSAFFPTKNPWDLTKVPGGSSGGSAAAVAADLCVFSLGTDTGGSIRQPAALTGTVGLKPTYGRVSRYGLVAMASSFDQIGPITKTVEDAALVLQAIAGFDSHDNTSVDRKDDFLIDLNKDLKGLRVGVPKEFFSKGLDAEVKDKIQETIQKLESLGAEIVEINLTYTAQALPVYYLIMPSEVSSNMARFDGIRFGSSRDKFGDEVKRRIMLGTYALSSGYYDAYYLRAAKVRTLIKDEFVENFSKVDVIVGPTTPTTAFNLGEKTSNPLQMYLADVYTIPANIAGLPAISINCGFNQGLPVGFQIIGKQWDEAKILNVANVLEKELALKNKPNLS